jgi:hypothetical protein
VAGEARAVQLSAFFLFAASVPLAVLTAALTGRLHGLGVRAAGPAIALAGGLLASAGLALCAAAQWALARTGDGAPAALVRALADVAFVTGGPWHAVGLGLLLAGVAVSAAFTGLLPRPVWQAGVVLAVVCELSTLVLLVPGAAYLLPVGRFGRPGLAGGRRGAAAEAPARAGGRPAVSARVLVTGGTGGIGLAAAEALARRGVEVLVTGRDAARGAAAEGRLRAAGTPGAFLRADHGSLADTRALVTGLRERLDGLDVLVANVGAMPSVRTTTPEGLDVELVTDVAGVVLLVDGLRPALAARGGRVVLVTSAAASRAPRPARRTAVGRARAAPASPPMPAPSGGSCSIAAGLAASCPPTVSACTPRVPVRPGRP